MEEIYDFMIRITKNWLMKSMNGTLRENLLSGCKFLILVKVLMSLLTGVTMLIRHQVAKIFGQILKRFGTRVMRLIPLVMGEMHQLKAQ